MYFFPTWKDWACIPLTLWRPLRVLHRRWRQVPDQTATPMSITFDTCVEYPLDMSTCIVHIFFKVARKERRGILSMSIGAAVWSTDTLPGGAVPSVPPVPTATEGSHCFPVYRVTARRVCVEAAGTCARPVIALKAEARRRHAIANFTQLMRSTLRLVRS